MTHCRDALTAGATPDLPDLAASVWQSSRNGEGQPTLAVVATSLDDLKEKLDAALGVLASRERERPEWGSLRSLTPQARSGYRIVAPPGEGRR